MIYKGHVGSPLERFNSLNKEKFSTNVNRRILEDPKLDTKRDYVEYTILENFKH